MAGRRCPGQHCPTILTNGERYCPRHAAEYEAKRGNSTQRGYDGAHRALREAWQKRIDAGEDVRCADGCGARIVGRAWDLGHSEDRGSHVGPQTIACNRADGGRRAHT